MKIEFSDQAKKDFQSIGPSDQVRIREKVKSLAQWPDFSGWKPMRRNWSGFGKCKAGDWRIIFRLPKPEDTVILITKIGHRSIIYDD